jgi:hypothetical protein
VEPWSPRIKAVNDVSVRPTTLRSCSKNSQDSTILKQNSPGYITIEHREKKLKENKSWFKLWEWKIHNIPKYSETQNMS